MKAAEWKREVRPLLPDEGWAFHGKVVYRTPVRRVLVGMLGEGSGWSRGIYLNRLRLPLFVPTEDWVLDWSERVGGGAHTYSTDDRDELVNALSTVLRDTGTEADALRHIASARRSTNWDMLEAVACSQILLGRWRRALRTIDRALGAPVTQDRAEPCKLRLEELRPLVASRQRDGAVHILDERCRQTAAALGITLAP